jgi:EamA domain-containing membrane protein RarD
MNFSLLHIASLFRYTGISFTAGAITHGFFSEERSLLTAVAGIACYLIGSAMEKYANPNNNQTWTRVLFIGIISSIGLGLFTGGLQHFPDSPTRSLWVVPLGFLLSLAGVYFLSEDEKTNKKTVMTYAAIGTAVAVIASTLAFKFFDDHDDDHHKETPTSKQHTPAGGHKH